MLYYTTLSDFPLSAWCPVDLCQTLKKADLENTDLENVVYVLLEKPWGSQCCSCVNNFSCVFPSLYFSNFSNVSHWMGKCRRQWLNFRGISFRYRWELKKQYNISRVYLHLSIKLSVFNFSMGKIPWLNFERYVNAIVLGGCIWRNIWRKILFKIQSGYFPYRKINFRVGNQLTGPVIVFLFQTSSLSSIFRV